MGRKVDTDTKRFVAIDANSLVHRAFHAFPSTLVTTEGTQVNAVYGFTSMLLRVLDDLDPKYLVCAFDLKAPTFRHTEFSDYKATRKPTDHTLIDQFPLVKEVVRAFNIPLLEKEGFEADDILGTLAQYVEDGKWSDNGLEMLIVTGDKDLLQMVSDHVSVWLPHGSFKDMRVYDEREVVKRFGFGPELIPDFKGLVGDPSDNIPGVKGVGEKTATDLIKEYGHLEEIYKNIEALKKRQQNLLSEGEESAEMSRRLARILTDVDLDVQLENCLMRDFQRNDVVEVFQRFEFRSLITKIPDSVNDDDGVQMGLFGGGEGEDGREVDGELDDIPSDVSGFSEIVIVYHSNGSCAVGLKKGDEVKDVYYSEDVTKGGVWERIADLLLDELPVCTYGWEDLCRMLCEKGLERTKRKLIFAQCGKKIFDVSLAAYHLSSGQRDYSLKNLAFVYTGDVLPDQGLEKDKMSWGTVTEVLEVARALEEELEKRSITIGGDIKRAGEPLVYEAWKSIDIQMSLASASMSEVGVKMDAELLEKKQTELREEIAVVEGRIYESIGHEFNINSNKQLADVLFNELKLPVQKRRKTGPSTDESVLRKLWGAHPCIEDILLYREKVKMENTYVSPLLEDIMESEDGRIHSVFLQTGTSTGRLSSRDPNLQNIPVRSELGREIRDMFVAEAGKMLLAIDYSQIDLRVMAHLSKDPLMIEDFESGVDFHRSTAARVLGKKDTFVTKKDRRIAKTINFGVLYGLSPFGLSEALDIEREEAAEYIESYFEKYSGVKEYLEKTIAEALSTGYVETAFGRRRYISGLKSGNRVQRSAAEREAINLPVQGTAADIMRAAMDDVYAYELERVGDIRLVLQIHDEFLFECEKDVVGEVAVDVKEMMEKAVELCVPLLTNEEKGESLASMKAI